MASIQPSKIADVLVVSPVVHADERGLLVETYRREWFPGRREMVQANRADRTAGAIVGLHHHLHQSDYWYVTAGRARVVLHDLRLGSPTEGATEAFDLGAAETDEGAHDHRGVLIPPGVAHGFAALTDVTISYLVDRYYDPADELGVAWNDPAVTVDWGLADPLLSGRDRANPSIADLPAEQRPVHPGGRSGSAAAFPQPGG